VTGAREPKVARLRWQAGDPVALSAGLRLRLGIGRATGTGRAADAGTRFMLGDDVLEVVPWRREGEGDEPRGDGRLVFEPVFEELAAGVDGADDPGAPALLMLAGVAWATVDLDRAADELGPWLLPADDGTVDGDEPLLGARTRCRRTTALPGSVIVLAEPSTEGRLAASLARDGEGPCAVYLHPAEGLDAWVERARGRGVTVSARRKGSLGPCVLVPGAATAGPHVIVVARRGPPSHGRRPGTIAP
jgi:hypothetical protein